MPLRSDIEAIEQSTVLSILYSTISAQQMNLLPENPSQNNTTFPKSRYAIYQTISQWLSSYGCTIIVRYFIIQQHNRQIFLNALAKTFCFDSLF